MATEARERIETRRRLQRAETPLAVRDDSQDEMSVSFPEFVFKEFIAAVAMTVFLLIVSIWLDARLLNRANPRMTHNPSKARWYLLGLQDVLFRFAHLNDGGTVSL